MTFSEVDQKLTIIYIGSRACVAPDIEGQISPIYEEVRAIRVDL